MDKYLRKVIVGEVEHPKLNCDSITCALEYNEYIYTGTYYGKFIKWDLNGKCIDITTIEESMAYTFCIFEWNGFIYTGQAYGVFNKWNYDGAHIKYIKTKFNTISKVNVMNNYIYVISRKNNHIILKLDQNFDCIATFKGHKDMIRCIINYNGFIYSGSSDNTIRKWDPNGECIQIIHHEYIVTDIIIYNNYLYVGTNNGEIKKYNLNGNYVQSFKRHKHWICSFAISNNILYSIDSYDNILKWDVLGNCIQKIDISTMPPSLSDPSVIVINESIYLLHYYFIKLGEYYSCHYTSLPECQKEKLHIWRSIKEYTKIHKDISFLIERELLL